jgi:hypothetical protein
VFPNSASYIRCQHSAATQYIVAMYRLLTAKRNRYIQPMCYMMYKFVSVTIIWSATIVMCACTGLSQHDSTVLSDAVYYLLRCTLLPLVNLSQHNDTVTCEGHWCCCSVPPTLSCTLVCQRRLALSWTLTRCQQLSSLASTALHLSVQT